MVLKIKILFWTSLVLSLVFVVNLFLFNGQLNNFGILPRKSIGLIGIVTSPFLHGNIDHLLNNLVGLGIFSFLTLMHGARYFWRASIFIIVMGGLGVWLTGRSYIHIGASGWIFGKRPPIPTFQLA